MPYRGAGTVKLSDAVSRALDPHVRVDHNLSAHPPRCQEVIGAMDRLRSSAKALGHLIANDCPESPERTEAMKALELTLMWALAGVERNQPDVVEPEPVPSQVVWPVVWPGAGEFAPCGPIGPL